MKKVQSFFTSILLLTGTSLLIRTVGIFFMSYLSGKIGSSGIGIYQLIMSVYSLAITLATSGIKFTTTRLVSEELGSGNQLGAKKAMQCCLLYSLGFSLSTAALLFFGADWIGSVWLDDVRTIQSLRVLAFGLPFTALIAVLNGYFTAFRKTGKPALIQIADQLVMIGTTIFLLRLFLPKGFEYACLSLVIGSILSEFLTCLLLLIGYLRHKKQLQKSQTQTSGLFSRMFRIALPIAFSSYARSGLSTIQHLLIPRGLNRYGASKEAAFTAYGNVHGMVLPLILYPSALLVTLAELLVPELTECQMKQSHKRINYITSRVFKLSLLFSVCVMGVLFCFSRELGESIYHNAQLSEYIKMLAPLVLVMYMDTVVDGMLKGLGEQFNSMKYNVIDSLASVIMVYFFIPAYGIQGYIMTVMVSEVLNFSLSLNRLIHITSIRLNLFNSLLKPFFCCILSVMSIRTFFGEESFFAVCLPQNLILQIICFIFIYLLFLILCTSLNREDINWMISILHPHSKQSRFCCSQSGKLSNNNTAVK